MQYYHNALSTVLDDLAVLSRHGSFGLYGRQEKFHPLQFLKDCTCFHIAYLCTPSALKLPSDLAPTCPFNRHAGNMHLRLRFAVCCRIRTRYLTKETKEKQEPDCIKTVSFGEGVGRLIKQGSFWLSGSSRSDLSGGPQTPDLNEQQQHITFYEAPELPAVLIKVSYTSHDQLDE